jgi:hypothetical protein
VPMAVVLTNSLLVNRIVSAPFAASPARTHATRNAFPFVSKSSELIPSKHIFSLATPPRYPCGYNNLDDIATRSQPSIRECLLLNKKSRTKVNKNQLL